MSSFSVAQVLERDLAAVPRSLRRVQGFLNNGFMPLPRLVKPDPRASAAVPGLAQIPVRNHKMGSSQMPELEVPAAPRNNPPLASVHA
jgi:hypothetical protein